jgi:hypothetical protein
VERGRLDFRIKALGQSASGAMDVTDDQVRVELHLPWLLQRLAESIRGAIQTQGRILLENKPRDQSRPWPARYQLGHSLIAQACMRTRERGVDGATPHALNKNTEQAVARGFRGRNRLERVTAVPPKLTRRLHLPHSLPPSQL